MKSREMLTPKLLGVSDPKSTNYGKLMSQKEIADTSGPPALSDTITWLQKAESTEATHDGVSLIHVRATVDGTEKAFGTKLGWHTPTISEPVADELSSTKANYSLARYLRAVASMTGVPSHLEDKIKFISLNSHLPTPKVLHSGFRDLGSQFAPTFPGKDSERNGPRPRPPQVLAPVTAAVVGNDNVIISSTLYFSEKVINQYSPPCSGDGNASVYLQAQAHSNVNVQSDPFLVSTQSILFDLPNVRIYCFNTSYGNICAGDNCTCVTRIKPLPKYQQFRLSVIQADAEFPSKSITSSINLSTSVDFVLTDIATPKFFQEFYNMPRGQTVRHGSNQSLKEVMDRTASKKAKKKDGKDTKTTVTAPPVSANHGSSDEIDDILMGGGCTGTNVSMVKDVSESESCGIVPSLTSVGVVANVHRRDGSVGAINKAKGPNASIADNTVNEQTPINADIGHFVHTISDCEVLLGISILIIGYAMGANAIDLLLIGRTTNLTNGTAPTRTNVLLCVVLSPPPHTPSMQQ
jgi:hypothetical protein